MKFTFSLVLIGLTLNACGTKASLSESKDAVVYGTHAFAYAIFPADKPEQVTVRRCPELVTIEDRGELKTKCPATADNTKVFDLLALKKYFVAMTKSPNTLESQLDSKGLQQLTQYREQLKQSEATEAARIKEEIAKAEQTIEALKKSLAANQDRRGALETYATEAGDERFLGEERHAELLQVRANILELPRSIDTQKALIESLQRELSASSKLFVDGRILFAQAMNPNNLCFVRPVDRQVLAVLTEMAFKNLP